MTYSIVWFKRDLRLHDHTALQAALARGPVLCVYVVEPGRWAQPDAANQHYQFLLESLRDLYAELKLHGGQLYVLQGELPAVLDDLMRRAPFTALFSHEETGNDLSYRRDVAIGRWCQEHSVKWHEFPQFGVVRKLRDRDLWQAAWNAQMDARCEPMPVLDAQSFMTLPWQPAPLLKAQALGLGSHDPAHRQHGGRRLGLSVLNSFLSDRCDQYRGGISSPLSAPTACSRLSPYIAYGCVSLREVVQATRRQLASLPPNATRQKQGLTAFTSRLYWHCHFIQKLESEPELEYRNLHRGYDGLREDEWNQGHFDALAAGRTGWPLIDACVAMLHETGWINFRMRAMLVSVAAYPLWLDWRPVGQWLARQFLDYEPGIHWSQMQMQSGTTGINVPRIYNPIKQAMDHDPHGAFVRRWLPAMRRVPDAWLFEPWRMPSDVQAHCGVRVGSDIAMALVDLAAATRQAKLRLFALRAQPEIKSAEAAIVQKHASRNRPDESRPKNTKKSSQLTLDF